MAVRLRVAGRYHLFTRGPLQHDLTAIAQRRNPVLIVRRVARLPLGFVHAEAVAGAQLQRFLAENLNFSGVQFGRRVVTHPPVLVPQQHVLRAAVHAGDAQVAIAAQHHLTGLPRLNAVKVVASAADALQHRYNNGFCAQLLRLHHGLVNAGVHRAPVVVERHHDKRLRPRVGRAAHVIGHDKSMTPGACPPSGRAA
ncbi:hypothetical protein, partial [Pantoea rodasii]|uniref:hypothetical protein n=1 Tax=Pantoea rodasii TaxID=1076549 RepID=UPI001FCCF0B8